LLPSNASIPSSTDQSLFNADLSNSQTALPNETAEDQSKRKSIELQELYRAHYSLIENVTKWLASERKKFSSGQLDGSQELSHNHHSTPTADVPNNEAGNLEELEKIVSKSLKTVHKASRHHLGNIQDYISGRRRPGLLRRLRGRSVATSDVDPNESDILVPACEAVLDNSKTLSYTNDEPPTASNMSIRSRRSTIRDHDAWDIFKFEIVRLAHTLKLRGWRRIPLDRGNEIKVQRLSGALTNAVYVVTVPSKLLEGLEDKSEKPASGPSTPSAGKRPQ
jgi:choline kinase